MALVGIVSALAQTTMLVPYEGGYFVKNGDMWTEYRPADKTGKWSTYKLYREDDTFFYVKNSKCELAIPKLGADKIFIKRDKNDKWEIVYNTIDVHYQCPEQDGLFYCYQDGRGREHNGYYVRGDNGEWREYAPGKKRGVWATFQQKDENKDYFIVESTKNVVKIPKKPTLNFVITSHDSPGWQGGYTTKAIYDRSSCYQYNFNYDNYAIGKKGDFKKGARISLDNKGNVQVAFDGKHYDFVYTGIDVVELVGAVEKKAIVITIDKKNRILLRDGSAHVECRNIGNKSLFFVGAVGKENGFIADQLESGTFHMSMKEEDYENREVVPVEEIPVEQLKKNVTDTRQKRYFDRILKKIRNCIKRIEESPNINEATSLVMDFQDYFNELRGSDKFNSMLRDMPEELQDVYGKRFEFWGKKLERVIDEKGLKLD